MKAIASRNGKFRHTVTIRDHQITVDEETEQGGQDAGPDPQELLAASLASCTAITMEMYAQRKGWEVGGIEVSCDYTPAERGAPTRFAVTLRLPETLEPSMVRKLQTIAAKCPVHRVLDGEVMFDERVELIAIPS
jgi:putative redox protein